jgi:hypothetical protein
MATAFVEGQGLFVISGIPYLARVFDLITVGLTD